MEIAVSAGSVVFVAHDDRLPRPAWLTEQFKPAAVALKVGGRPMTLFQRRFAEAGSLTLGSNAPDAAAKDCHMYLVFVAKSAP